MKRHKINIFIPSYTPVFVCVKERLKMLKNFVDIIMEANNKRYDVEYHIYIFSTHYSSDYYYIKSSIITYIDLEYLGITDTRKYISSYIYENDLNNDIAIFADDDITFNPLILNRFENGLNGLLEKIVGISNENKIGLINLQNTKARVTETSINKLHNLEFANIGMFECSMYLVNFNYFDYNNIEFDLQDDEFVIYSHCFKNKIKMLGIKNTSLVLNKWYNLPTTIKKEFKFNFTKHKQYFGDWLEQIKNDLWFRISTVAEYEENGCEIRTHKCLSVTTLYANMFYNEFSEKIKQNYDLNFTIDLD